MLRSAQKTATPAVFVEALEDLHRKAVSDPQLRWPKDGRVKVMYPVDAGGRPFRLHEYWLCRPTPPTQSLRHSRLEDVPVSTRLSPKNRISSSPSRRQQPTPAVQQSSWSPVAMGSPCSVHLRLEIGERSVALHSAQGQALRALAPLAALRSAARAATSTTISSRRKNMRRSARTRPTLQGARSQRLARASGRARPGGQRCPHTIPTTRSCSGA